MGKKKKNIINVQEAKTFMWQAYGLKSRVENEYHLVIVHPELRAYFDWYHTKGTLVARIHDGTGVEQVSLGKYLTDEEVAIKICRYANNLLQHENCPYYREPRGKHSPQAVSNLIYGKTTPQE